MWLRQGQRLLPYGRAPRLADVGPDTRAGFYLARPGGGQGQFFSHTSTLTGTDETLLGFGANALVEMAIVDGQATATFYPVEDGQYEYVETATGLPAAVAGSTLEMAVPYEVVGKPNAGDVLESRAFIGQPNNAWGTPNDMGIHTLDLYMNAVERGARKLLPGRNVATPADHAWDFVLWAEGWTPGLFGPPAEGSPEPQQIDDAGTMAILSEPGTRQITTRVPKKVLVDQLGVPAADLQPASWRYLGVVLGLEGFPASGVWRVRDVNARAEQWRFGGALANSTTHTRIVDVAYPADFATSQENVLSGFSLQNTPSSQLDALGPDDLSPNCRWFVRSDGQV